MRKFTFLLSALAIICLSFSIIDNMEAQVKKAAQQQLQTALAGIPAGQETGFGFSSREEFKSATVGEVFRTISLTKEFYQDDQLINRNYIHVQNEWRVPVVVNGDNRVLLTVAGHDTALNVVDIGGAMLAKEMQAKSNGQSSKDKFIFRIYPLTMDFIVLVEHGKSLEEGNYYPMNSAVMAIPTLDGSSMTQAEVFQQIKKKLKDTSKN